MSCWNSSSTSLLATTDPNAIVIQTSMPEKKLKDACCQTKMSYDMVECIDIDEQVALLSLCSMTMTVTKRFGVFTGLCAVLLLVFKSH